MTYIVLPVRGSPFWGDPVDSVADLPPSGQLGEVRLDLGTGDVYYWDGTSWVLISAGAAPLTVSDTDSIDLTLSAMNLTADLRLSGDAADLGNLLVALNIQGGASPGLRAQVSTTALRGLISAATPLNYDPVTGLLTYELIRDGTLPTNVQPGYETSGTAAAFTATGVGLTGAWGAVTSVALAPGVYSLRGVCGLAENDAVLTSSLSCGISDAADGSSMAQFSFAEYPWLVSGDADAQVVAPEITVSISSPTTYYLNSRFWYTSGSPMHRGTLIARLIA